MRDVGVCAIQLHGDVPRMHSADGEPEHEPHTVTDDSTVCITICDTKCKSERFTFKITNIQAKCDSFDITNIVSNNETKFKSKSEPDGVTYDESECESECESE